MNKVILVGRLGQCPELKHTPNGVAVCNFTIATTEKWKDKSGADQEKTEWSRIVAWSKQAELCNQYLNVGSQVLIEGKLATRSWEDKEGNKRYTTEIICTHVEFLGQSGGSKEQDQEKEPKKDYTPNNNVDFASDDIPF